MRMPSFYEPTQETLTKLNGPWCVAYSGGKDSTGLVTWIEFLRRSGMVVVNNPQLVQSDTGVEDFGLQNISEEMMVLLRKHGWECVVVKPKLHEKLYNQILGRGQVPVHPGFRKMRWCTRATKVDPMKRWQKENSDGLMLTGLRLGESSIRDGKLKLRGCSAGGECGIPDPGDNLFSPIINWTTCQVVDWLNGMVARDVYVLMQDIFTITGKLVEIYEVKIGQQGFGIGEEPEVEAARFGCQGCPAIAAGIMPPKAVVRRNGIDSPLTEIYSVWFDARKKENRLFRVHNTQTGIGPIKMAYRHVMFDRIMDIQQRSGIILITEADQEYIRQCWVNKVYPRGWSEADELTPAPDDSPLLVNCT